jgi:hypothetical protein
MMLGGIEYWAGCPSGRSFKKCDLSFAWRATGKSASYAGKQRQLFG